MKQVTFAPSASEYPDTPLLRSGTLSERLGAEEAVFPGAAPQPQLLGEPFNRRVAEFWRAAG